MIKLEFTDVYVVVKDKESLLSPTVYDFNTAATIVDSLKSNGNKDAEVISLWYAFSKGYRLP